MGTERKLIVATIRRQFVFAPDNGLITWAIRRHGCEATDELVWRPDRYSNTFHGRDILAPAAAMSAAGTLTDDAVRPLGQVMMLKMQLAASLAEASVLAIDSFGNVITNVPGEMVKVGQMIAGRAKISRTFADAPRRRAVAYVGSSGPDRSCRQRRQRGEKVPATRRPVVKSKITQVMTTEQLRNLDRQYVWHPFTHMSLWLGRRSDGDHPWRRRVRL